MHLWSKTCGNNNSLCSDLLEERVWTVLKNNLSPQTSVTSTNQEGKAALHITYNVTDEQVNNSNSSTKEGRRQEKVSTADLWPSSLLLRDRRCHVNALSSRDPSA